MPYKQHNLLEEAKKSPLSIALSGLVCMFDYGLGKGHLHIGKAKHILYGLSVLFFIIILPLIATISAWPLPSIFMHAIFALGLKLMMVFFTGSFIVFGVFQTLHRKDVIETACKIREVNERFKRMLYFNQKLMGLLCYIMLMILISVILTALPIANSIGAFIVAFFYLILLMNIFVQLILIFTIIYVSLTIESSNRINALLQKRE
ncbi:MAG: hypothetical protein ACO2ZM_03350 [Francisellaceae bacterium]